MKETKEEKEKMKSEIILNMQLAHLIFIKFKLP